ncbi:hypothetical protein [Salininema proteolyticum]|uniref:Uncharacterized protein n=1 Tax=Salininema proteolyticum TaxID=1607685 RepID=A0ABV8TZA1_9ACTN
MRLHYDVAPLFAVDPRITVSYTVPAGPGASKYRHQAELFAHRHRLPLVPWSELPTIGADLLLTSSPRPEMLSLGIPVATLPHGAGHNRFLPETEGVAGLSRDHLRTIDGTIPSLISLPGKAALDRLRTDAPEAAERAVVTGDLCFERILDSRSLRDEYRRALGITPEQALVTVTSTWGRDSLIGRHVDLVSRLHEMIDLDSTSLAYIPHPNIDGAHQAGSAALVQHHLTNGLVMVPPEEGWRALLIASDYVLGDHGSVTYYAAALGKKVAIGEFGFDEMPEDGPLAELGRSLPRLPLSENIFDELFRVPAVDPESTAQVLDRDVDCPSAVFAESVYDRLGIPAPRLSKPRQLPLPDLEIGHARPKSWAVDRRGGGMVRRPLCDPTRPPITHPVAADVSCLSSSIKAEATLITRLHLPPLGRRSARTEAERVMSGYPRCSMTAMGTDERTVLVTFRDGRSVEVPWEVGVEKELGKMLLSAD